MKKIIFTLLALVGTMSMNAQVMKIMKGETVVATYTAEQADNVVFEEVPALTKGTAKATIGGSEVDVNWVQLWENGPKFAEYNVGASSATEKGTAMIFTKATEAGDAYVWGANWCTPSKEDMDELLNAASSSGSEKVKCEIVRESNVEAGNIIGFKFTGKETGYTGNSVFFPAGYGTSSFGNASYWSATADGSNKAWYMYLYYVYTSTTEGKWQWQWVSDWVSGGQGTQEIVVRPVLKN